MPPTGKPLLTKKQKKEHRREIKKKKNTKYEKVFGSQELYQTLKMKETPTEKKLKIVDQLLKEYTKSNDISEFCTVKQSSLVIQAMIKYGSTEQRQKIATAIVDAGSKDDGRDTVFTALMKDAYGTHVCQSLMRHHYKGAAFAPILKQVYGRVPELASKVYSSVALDFLYRSVDRKSRLGLLYDFYGREAKATKELLLAKPGKVALRDHLASIKRADVWNANREMTIKLLDKGLWTSTLNMAFFTEVLRAASTSDSDTAFVSAVAGHLCGEVRNAKGEIDKEADIGLPLLSIVETAEGAELAALVIGLASRAQRKKVVHGIRPSAEHETMAADLACDKNGAMLIIALLTMVDDTKLLNEQFMRHLMAQADAVLADPTGVRTLVCALEDPTDKKRFPLLDEFQRKAMLTSTWPAIQDTPEADLADGFPGQSKKDSATRARELATATTGPDKTPLARFIADWMVAHPALLGELNRYWARLFTVCLGYIEPDEELAGEIAACFMGEFSEDEHVAGDRDFQPAFRLHLRGQNKLLKDVLATPHGPAVFEAIAAMIDADTAVHFEEKGGAAIIKAAFVNGQAEFEKLASSNKALAKLAKDLKLGQPEPAKTPKPVKAPRGKAAKTPKDDQQDVQKHLARVLRSRVDGTPRKRKAPGATGSAPGTPMTTRSGRVSTPVRRNPDEGYH
ncbi:ARM repeat-containing protein [Carpediemonas membranifera]|uniref:ARM repeat-containing protein n=1 Tax=Carpediemonas membranifera TaxID=201153 RepID=A0A8J6AWC9_9EUKA|nr:ARM repeat-containing protein [Carpediemonas membranifera]|eukprot:KAG9393240.1 ARM repeat-containing protein [Carpediemonas membranifera]